MGAVARAAGKGAARRRLAPPPLALGPQRHAHCVGQAPPGATRRLSGTAARGEDACASGAAGAARASRQREASRDPGPRRRGQVDLGRLLGRHHRASGRRAGPALLAARSRSDAPGSVGRRPARSHPTRVVDHGRRPRALRRRPRSPGRGRHRRLAGLLLLAVRLAGPAPLPGTSRLLALALVMATPQPPPSPRRDHRSRRQSRPLRVPQPARFNSLPGPHHDKPRPGPTVTAGDGVSGRVC